jgi:hypothetical protein
LLCAHLGVSQGSLESAYLKLYFSFLLSATIHHVGAMNNPYTPGVKYQFWFFLLQAVAITTEDLLCFLGRRWGVLSSEKKDKYGSLTARGKDNCSSGSCSSLRPLLTLLTACSEAEGNRLSLGFRFPKLFAPIYGFISYRSRLLQVGASSCQSLQRGKIRARGLVDRAGQSSQVFQSKSESRSSECCVRHKQVFEEDEAEAVLLSGRKQDDEDPVIRVCSAPSMLHRPLAQAKYPAQFIR